MSNSANEDRYRLPAPVADPLEGFRVELVRDPTRLDALADALAGATRVAVDVETNDCEVVHLGNRPLWVALRVTTIGFDDKIVVVDHRDVPPAALAAFVAHASAPAAAWNASFDEFVLDRVAVRLPHGWRDLMLTDAVLHQGVPGRGFYLGLAEAARRYCGVIVEGKGTVQTSFGPTEDLTDAQVAYAAGDVAVTLRVGAVLDARLRAAGLEAADAIVQAARPFFADLERTGVPFDEEGWKARLAEVAADRDAALATIAELTGGAELTLFETAPRPRFNVNSDPQLREQLNRYDAAAVAAAFGRPLERTDPLNKSTLGALKRQGSALAAAVLAYREKKKVLSTYGEGVLRYVRDGRIRSEYLLALTDTARPKSRNPNAQNLAPQMKAYIRPRGRRVLVAGDYSQAELRVLAYLAGERSQLDAFAAGVDLHKLAAEQIFKVDLDEMARTDPDQAKKIRTKTKRVNFGLPYGIREHALARQLTDEGVPSTPEEARAIMDGHAREYPAVHAWLAERDAYVEQLRRDPGPIDWAASLDLVECHLAAKSLRKTLRQSLGRYPAGVELAEHLEPEAARRDRLTGSWGRPPTDAELAADLALAGRRLDWAFGFDAPVVLRPDGTPFAFESRSAGGHRRLFQVPMLADPSDKWSGVITSAVLIVGCTDKPIAAAARDQVAAEMGIDGLPVGTDRTPRHPRESREDAARRRRELRNAERNRVRKAFEGVNKARMLDFVRRVTDRMGDGMLEVLLHQALADQIGKLANAYRNHPIQGAVAEVLLLAAPRLLALREEFPGQVHFAQSVHDSIICEVDAAVAREVAARLEVVMTEAMEQLFPGIPAKVDVEVKASLAEADDLSAADLAALAADAA